MIVSRADRQNCIGKVLELIQVVGSEAKVERRPDYILLTLYDTVASEKFRMPKLVKSAIHLLADYRVTFAVF